ncbi:MAG: hypothetical protein IT428_12185 [Planctomycetaceae bacterium]|nr:hypothetical protein [Planctomycetaceae bacterium]
MHNPDGGGLRVRLIGCRPSALKERMESLHKYGFGGMSRIDQILAKIERANKHILEFEECLNAFRNSKPYRLVIEDNPDSRERVYKVKVLKPPPLELSLIAGDAIHNLRSALDHLVWRLIEANGNVPSRQTAFPVSETRAKYEAGSPAKVQGMNPSAVDLINAIKPYKGGSDEIWALHELNNFDKHRLLLVVGYSNSAAALTLSTGSPTSGMIIFGMPIQPDGIILEDGAVIGGFRGGTPNPELQHNLDFSFEIAFREPQIVQGKPVLPFVNQTSHLVDKIIRQFASHL